MPCTPVREFVARVGSNCLETLGLKQKSSKMPDIGRPFNFKQGPPVHFPGFSEDDISLLREKAIASTAIVHGEFDFGSQLQPDRFLSYSLGSRGMYRARRVSRGYLH